VRGHNALNGGSFDLEVNSFSFLIQPFRSPLHNVQNVYQHSKKSLQDLYVI